MAKTELTSTGKVIELNIMKTLLAGPEVLAMSGVILDCVLIVHLIWYHATMEIEFSNN